MNKINVNIICKDNTIEIPKKGTNYSSGYDLAVDIEKDLILKPLETIDIPTGIKIQIEDNRNNIEFQIRARSSISYKGILVHFSTIDSDYQGEIKLIVTNLNNHEFLIKPRMRLAQLVCLKYYDMDFNKVNKFENETERGNKGFGSTGI